MIQKIKKTKVNKKTFKGSIIFLIVVLSGVFGYFILRWSTGSSKPISVVSSNSMYPAIKKGDVVFLNHKKPENIKNGTIENMEGDVIAYNPKGLWKDNKLPARCDVILHRVVGKYYNETDKMWYFYAKGDNNSYVDPPYMISQSLSIREDKIVGILTYKISYIGYPIIWVKMPNVYFPIIMFLGILILVQSDRDSHNKKDMETWCQYHKEAPQCDKYYVELKDVFQRKK